MADNHLISLSITGTLIFVLFFTLLILAVLYIRRKENQHHQEKRHLLLAIINEGERMMNQISKEVHDNIGQLSNLLHITMRRIETTPDKTEKAELFKNAYKITALLISNSKNISYSLKSDFIKGRGLCNVIQDDVEHIRATGNISCYIDIVGKARFINPDKELVIYRIAQEAMHNVLKHANASLIDVRLYYFTDLFKMEIKDNGVGFNSELMPDNGGNGFINMRARTELLNGTLEIISSPGNGCAISLQVGNLDTF